MGVVLSASKTRVRVGENVRFDITDSDTSYTSNYTLYINGKNVTYSSNKYFNRTFDSVGTYNVYVMKWSGDGDLRSNDVYVTVSESVYVLTASSNSYDVDDDGDVTIEITLTDNDEPMGSETVTLTDEDSNSYTATTDSDGVATFNLTNITNSGVYTASYTGAEDISVNVIVHNYNVEFLNNNYYTNNGSVSINVVLYDNELPVNDETISLIGTGISTSATTNNDGIATFNLTNITSSMILTASYDNNYTDTCNLTYYNTNTLNGSLSYFAKQFVDNLKEMNVDAVDESDGLTTLAGKILDISGEIVGLDLVTSININAPTDAIINTPFTITGVLEADFDDRTTSDDDLEGYLSGATVKIYNGASLLGTTVTNQYGVYSFSYTPLTLDSLSVKAVYDGETYYDNCESSTVNINVGDGTIYNLLLTTDAPAIQEGDTTTITALLTNCNVPVTNEELTYQIKRGETVIREDTDTTDNNGEIEIEYEGGGYGDITVLVEYDELSETLLIEDCTYYNSGDRVNDLEIDSGVSCTTNGEYITITTSTSGEKSVTIPTILSGDWEYKVTMADFGNVQDLAFQISTSSGYAYGGIDYNNGVIFARLSGSGDSTIYQRTVNVGGVLKITYINGVMSVYWDNELLESRSATITGKMTFYTNQDRIQKVKDIKMKLLNKPIPIDYELELVSNKNILSYYDEDEATVTVTITNGLDITEQSLDYVVTDSLDQTIDSGTGLQITNGVGVISYTSRGIGDVTITASYQGYSESIVLEDCYYYDANPVHNTSMNIPLPSNAKISYDMRKTGMVDGKGGPCLTLEDSTYNYLIGNWSSTGYNGFLLRTKGSSSNIINQQCSQLTTNTDYNIWFTYDNGAGGYGLNNETLSFNLQYIPTKLTKIEIGQQATMNNLKVKVLHPPVISDYDVSLSADNTVIQKNGKSTITATVTNNNVPSSGETVVFKKDNVTLDTVITDSNGEADYEYTGTGIGDVSIIAECQLVEKSITIEDCIYVNMNQYDVTRTGSSTVYGVLNNDVISGLTSSLRYKVEFQMKTSTAPASGNEHRLFWVPSSLWSNNGSQPSTASYVGYIYDRKFQAGCRRNSSSQNSNSSFTINVNEWHNIRIERTGTEPFYTYFNDSYFTWWTVYGAGNYTDWKFAYILWSPTTLSVRNIKVKPL